MKKPNTIQNGKQNPPKEERLEITSWEVSGVKMFDNGGVVFDLMVNGLKIYGCRVVETDKGDFIALPQRKGKDGKYYSIVWARFTEADTKIILDAVQSQL